MKSEVEAITDMFYVGNSHNTSRSNDLDIKSNWCCNIPTCWDNSRGEAGKRASQISKPNTNVDLDDIKLTVSRHGEGPLLVKRKLPRKTKGLNVKNKIRRTFALCCTYGQSISFDDDEDDTIDSNELREDEHGLSTADDKIPNEEQNRNEEKREPESFWKMLNPYVIDCSTPTNILQVYAADVQTYVTTTTYGPVSNNEGFQSNRPEYDNWQNWNSDSSGSSDSTSSSTEDSLSCSDILSLFLENLESSTSSSGSSSSAQCDGILAGYDANTENKEMQLTLACEEANEQSGTRDDDSLLHVKLEQPSCELVSSTPTYSSLLSCETDPPLTFNLHSTTDEAESQLTNSEDTSQESDASTVSYNDMDNFEILALVYDMVTGGQIGFRRDLVEEPYNSEERLAIEFIHCNSGLPYAQVKRLINKISGLVNTKYVEFIYSSSSEASPWFSVTSYTGDRLIFSQETETDTNVNDGNYTELQTEAEQTTDQEISNCDEETVAADDENSAEKKNYHSGNVSSNRDYIQTIRDGTFSSVLDEIRKARAGDTSSDTETLHPVYDDVFEAEDVNRPHLPDYVCTINDGHFSNFLDSVLKSKYGCTSSNENAQCHANNDFQSGLNSPPFVSEGNDLFSEDSSQTLYQGNILPVFQQEDLLTAFADGMILGYLSEPTAPASSVSNELIPSTSTDDEILQFQPVSEEKPESFGTDKRASNFPFAENALPRTENEHVLSKKQDAIKDEISGAQCMNNKAVPGVKLTSSLVTAPVQTRNNRNRSKLRERQVANKEGIVRENSLFHARNQSYLKSKSSVANAQTTSVTGSPDIVAKACKSEPAQDLTGSADSNVAGPDNNNRRIKTAKRRLKNVTKDANGSVGSVPKELEAAPSIVPVQLEAASPIVPVQPDSVPSVDTNQIVRQVDELQPLHLIETDVDATTAKVEEAPPVYIETDATIDYGRCAVEPGHGERPDKKKLRAEIKEKVKTKGEANKHLKVERETYFPCYEDVMEEYLADEADDIEHNISVEHVPEEPEEGARAMSPVVLNAVDQPQVLDDRELQMVPETIKRVDDPYLVDVEEDYKVSTTHSNKKEKRKQKDDRKKEKKTKKAGQTILKFA